MNDELEGRLRKKKVQTEENSKIIEKLVDSITAKYSNELDRLIEETKELLENKDRLTDDEVENLTLRVPIYLYFMASGIENLGIEGDNAKAIKLEVYNKAYMNADGTIGDKTAEAEYNSLTEQLLEMAYQRAYKKLKTKFDVCIQLCQASRKVLHKRISELDINKQEPSYLKNADREDDFYGD